MASTRRNNNNNEPDNNQNKGRRWLWLTGCILMLAFSAYLILKPTIIDHLIINPAVVESATANMESVDAKTLEKNQKRILSIAGDSDGAMAVNDAGYSYPVSGDPNIDYDASQVSAVGEIPSDATLNYDYMVGEIIMPSVDMHVPILEGISNENLWLGAGTMKPGQKMGQRNYALAGHHMWDPSQLFTPIMNSEIGDAVYVTDKNMIHEYKVTDMFVAAESDGYLVNDSEVSESGMPMITLVTCTDVWGTDRYIVIGELVDSYSVDDSKDETLSAMISGE